MVSLFNIIFISYEAGIVGLKIPSLLVSEFIFVTLVNLKKKYLYVSDHLTCRKVFFFLINRFWFPPLSIYFKNRGYFPASEILPLFYFFLNWFYMR